MGEVREWIRILRVCSSSSSAFLRIVLFHAALVTLCSRPEHGPRKLVAWVDTSSDVFSKSKSQGRRRHSAGRSLAAGAFLKWCRAGCGSRGLNEDWREADCRLTFGVLVQCPGMSVLLLEESAGVREEEEEEW
jgi:hypothetical protein